MPLLLALLAALPAAADLVYLSTDDYDVPAAALSPAFSNATLLIYYFTSQPVSAGHGAHMDALRAANDRFDDRFLFALADVAELPFLAGHCKPPCFELVVDGQPDLYWGPRNDRALVSLCLPLMMPPIWDYLDAPAKVDDLVALFAPENADKVRVLALVDSDPADAIMYAARQLIHRAPVYVVADKNRALAGDLVPPDARPGHVMVLGPRGDVLDAFPIDGLAVADIVARVDHHALPPVPFIGPLNYKALHGTGVPSLLVVVDEGAPEATDTVREMMLSLRGLRSPAALLLYMARFSEMDRLVRLGVTEQDLPFGVLFFDHPQTGNETEARMDKAKVQFDDAGRVLEWIDGVLAGRNDSVASTRPNVTQARITELFQKAHSYFVRGELERSADMYRHLISLTPSFAVVHVNLGQVLQQQRKLDEAEARMRMAVDLDDSLLEAHYGLGNVLFQTRRFSDAILAYHRATECDNGANPAVYNNLGNAYRELAEYDQAVHWWREALDLSADYPPSLVNMGAESLRTGAYDEARTWFDRALAVTPANHDARLGLARLHHAQGDADGAFDVLQVILDETPEHGPALVEVANVMHDQARFSDALVYYQRGMQDGATPETFHRVGRLLFHDLGRPRPALRFLSTAAELKPTLVAAQLDYGLAALAVGDNDHALAAFAAAQRFATDDCRVVALLTRAQIETGDIDAAMAILDRAQGACAGDADFVVARARASAAVGDWQIPEGLVDLAGDVHPRETLGFPLPPATQRLLAEAWAARVQSFADRVISAGSDQPYPSWSGSEPLVVGYVSSGFGRHPVGQAIQGVLRSHDKERFRIVCFSLGTPDDSEERADIAQMCDRFGDMSMHEADVIAQLVREAGVHVLVNLDGYAPGERTEIFAYRPAPLQIVLPLAYPGTTGALFHDFVVTDRTTSPPDLFGGEFLERALYLEPTLAPSDLSVRGPGLMMDADDEEEEALLPPASAFVLAHFGPLAEVDGQTLDVWARILLGAPQVVLWLETGSSPAVTRVCAAFAAHGIECADSRVVFTGRPSLRLRAARADLVLDGIQFHGLDTTLDALYVGIPVLTAASGDRMRSRRGAALVGSCEPGLVAPSLEAYEKMAIDFATGAAQLPKISCPTLFDVEAWTRGWEAALVGLQGANDSQNEVRDEL